MDRDHFGKIAQEAVREAGKLLMDNFEKVETMSFKGKSDIVTEIDVLSERIMEEKLNVHFPGHSILSEEKGFTDNSSSFTWIMDPIDGTINYYFGTSPFRVALCLLEDKKPVITAIYNPLKDQLYFSEVNKGAFLNGKRIKVNENFDVKNSVVMTHLSSKKEARARTILALENIFSKTMHMRMFGSGLAAMTYIANGKFDVFFNVKTNPWDIMPGALLIEEAGGIVTDIKGEKITYESTSVLATNGKVHTEMLRLLENI
jgi:myo-inositol-1(or 4)-monophosphatase